jgi:hypothetical protein
VSKSNHPQKRLQRSSPKRSLAELAELHAPTVPEDVAVWQGGRLVLVIRPDGSRVWVRPECRSEAA